MSWEDQGRQTHGWFGNGKAPDGNQDARIDAIAYAAIASIPARTRGHFSASFDRHSLGQLRTAMAVWMNARTLDRASFADILLDPSVPRAAVDRLRVAAEVARNARSRRQLAHGSAALADAMTGIGLGRWPRFLRDAARRADANQAIVQQVSLVGQPKGAMAAAPADLPPPLTGQELVEFRAAFDRATTIAYQLYSHDCSHYLHEFLVQMGHPEIPAMTANQFMVYARSSGSGWQHVTCRRRWATIRPRAYRCGGIGQARRERPCCGRWSGMDHSADPRRCGEVASGLRRVDRQLARREEHGQSFCCRWMDRR